MVNCTSGFPVADTNTTRDPRPTSFPVSLVLEMKEGSVDAPVKQGTTGSFSASTKNNNSNNSGAHLGVASTTPLMLTVAGALVTAMVHSRSGWLLLT